MPEHQRPTFQDPRNLPPEQLHELVQQSATAAARDPNNPRGAVELMYLLEHALLSVHELGPRWDEYHHQLVTVFAETSRRFENDASYQFFTGYFVGLADWLFSNEGDQIAGRMVAKAAALQPSEPLYRWGALMTGEARNVGGQRELQALTTQILADASAVRWLSEWGRPGEYLLHVLESSVT